MQTIPMTELATTLRTVPDTKVAGDVGTATTPTFSLNLTVRTGADPMSALAQQNPSMTPGNAITNVAPTVRAQLPMGEYLDWAKGPFAPEVAEVAQINVASDAPPIFASVGTAPSNSSPRITNLRPNHSLVAETLTDTPIPNSASGIPAELLPSEHIRYRTPASVLTKYVATTSLPTDAPGTVGQPSAQLLSEAVLATAGTPDWAGEQTQMPLAIANGSVTREPIGTSPQVVARSALPAEAPALLGNRTSEGLTRVSPPAADNPEAVLTNAKALAPTGQLATDRPVDGRANRWLSGALEPPVPLPGKASRPPNPTIAAIPESFSSRPVPPADTRPELTASTAPVGASRPDPAPNLANLRPDFIPKLPIAAPMPTNALLVRQPSSLSANQLEPTRASGLATPNDAAQKITAPVVVPVPGPLPYAGIQELRVNAEQPIQSPIGSPTPSAVLQTPVTEPEKNAANALIADKHYTQSPPRLAALSTSAIPGAAPGTIAGPIEPMVPPESQIARTRITDGAITISAAATSIASATPASGPPGPSQITRFAQTQSAEPRQKVSVETPQTQTQIPVAPNVAMQTGQATAVPIASWISAIQAASDTNDPARPTAELVNASSPDALPRDIPRGAPDIRVPQQVAQQLAQAARMLPDRPVELTLNPEELGRVRMTLVAGDGAISVALSAERPETADMLRRHIETLSQEFRQLGYRDISFSFAGGQAGQHRQDTGDPARPLTEPTVPEPAPEDTSPARIVLSGGVDLRL